MHPQVRERQHCRLFPHRPQPRNKSWNFSSISCAVVSSTRALPKDRCQNNIAKINTAGQGQTGIHLSGCLFVPVLLWRLSNGVEALSLRLFLSDKVDKV